MQKESGCTSLHQFISRFMRILFPEFWTIRPDRIAYSLVPDRNVTAKIQLNFKTLAGPSNEGAFQNFLVLVVISERGTGSLIPFSTTDPDPTACDPRSRRYDP